VRVGVNASFGDTFANPKRTVHKRSMTSMRGIQRSYAEIKGFVPKAGSSTTANLEVSLAAPACAAPACAGCMAVWILSAISWCACFASNAFFLYCAFIRKLPEGAIWRDRVASLCLGLYASMTVSGLQMGVFLKECFWECFFRVVAHSLAWCACTLAIKDQMSPCSEHGDLQCLLCAAHHLPNYVELEPCSAKPDPKTTSVACLT